MKSTFLALLPAIIANLILFLSGLFNIGGLILLALLLFLLGAFVAGACVGQALMKINQNLALSIFVGLLVGLLYLVTFLFTGCVALFGGG